MILRNNTNRVHLTKTPSELGFFNTLISMMRYYFLSSVFFALMVVLKNHEARGTGSRILASSHISSRACQVAVLVWALRVHHVAEEGLPVGEQEALTALQQLVVRVAHMLRHFRELGAIVWRERDETPMESVRQLSGHC